MLIFTFTLLWLSPHALLKSSDEFLPHLIFIEDEFVHIRQLVYCSHKHLTSFIGEVVFNHHDFF